MLPPFVLVQGMPDEEQQRLGFWKQKREDVLAQIRSEGVEVDEKIVLGYRNPKSRDWERGGKVMICSRIWKKSTKSSTGTPRN